MAAPSSEPHDVRRLIDNPDRRETLRTWVQLARTHAKFVQRMSLVFGSHGMTGPQFDVLATLRRKEGITQQEMASSLLVDEGQRHRSRRSHGSAGMGGETSRSRRPPGESTLP